MYQHRRLTIAYFWLNQVYRANHTHTAFIQYMGINHGRGYICMTQQFLNSTNIIARLQQMGRKRMAQRMTIHFFIDSCQL